MSITNKLIILFFWGLCLAQDGHGQPQTTHQESIHHFNAAKMLERIGSRLREFRKFENISIDSDVLSLLDGFKEVTVSDGAFVQSLTNFLKQMGSDKCYQDIEYVFQNLNMKDKWGLKILDAFGKPGNGILEGNFKWIGNYHECTNAYAPGKENSTVGDFYGQYCTLQFNGDSSNKIVSFLLGICLPDSCSSVEWESFKDAISPLPRIGSLLSNVTLTCQPTSKKLTSAAIAMICLIAFFVLLAVLGSSFTLYEYFIATIKKDTSCAFNKQMPSEISGDLEKLPNEGSSSEAILPFNHDDDENGWYGKFKEFFNCFCIFTNGEKILNTDSTEGQLLCLHGIRFLSMSWVIIGHTYLACIYLVVNLVEALDMVNTWLFQVILNGFYSVDSFFLLSGFLVAHLFFQESAKTNGKVPWLYFYIHRYIRLTPVYMIVLGFFTALTYYTGSGPFWTTDEIEPVCKENWWWNLIYINNFISNEKECMAWTWYLANDMQFFIICPIILITLWRWPTIGYSVLGLFLSASFAANFGITYHFDLLTGFGDFASPNQDGMKDTLERSNMHFNKIYVKPYTRISPYLVGIALAYYLFRRKQNNQGKINLITLCCGWIVASTVTLTCVFCLYHRQLTLIGSGFYEAMGHACFAGGLGWVIFTCLNGQGGAVNSILSFKLFIPLSRLTYCAYLIHPIILTAYFGALKVPFHFSHFTVVTSFLGLLVITYAFSFLVSVLFESPIIRLEKLIRTKLKSL